MKHIHAVQIIQGEYSICSAKEAQRVFLTTEIIKCNDGKRCVKTCKSSSMLLTIFLQCGMSHKPGAVGNS